MKTALSKAWLVVALVVLLVGAATTAYVGSSYRIDTVTFVDVGSPSTAVGPEPSVRIDTGVTMSGMFGGRIESVAPFALAIDYSDPTSDVREAEITGVVVTYDDGATEPLAASLKLPLRIPARPFETINSMAGGRIVKSEVRVISDAIPDAVRRVAPVTISIEGSFVRDDGIRIPFSLRRRFDAIRDRSVKSWFEVMSGC